MQSLSRVGARCPITALDTARVGDSGDEILFYGTGGCMVVEQLLHATAPRHAKTTLEIFQTHNIHGVWCASSIPCTNSQRKLVVVVFGEKAISLVVTRINSNTTAASTSTSIETLPPLGALPAVDPCFALSVAARLEGLDDNVLDCRLLDRSSASATTTFTTATLVVGYAHNFVDILELELDTIKQPQELYKRVRRCFCPEISAQFGLSIHVHAATGQVLVASGTVFGKIILWTMPALPLPPACSSSSSTSSSSLSSTSASASSSSPGKDAGTLLATCHEHEGVIFRLTWSRDGSRLITVSDDRTVRLWRIVYGEVAGVPMAIEAVYTGWGHISRLWDGVFLDRSDNNSNSNSNSGEMEIATSSEDGTIKVWDASGTCVATLRGKIVALRCIASHYITLH
jgi:hypothetical protein